MHKVSTVLVMTLLALDRVFHDLAAGQAGGAAIFF